MQISLIIPTRNRASSLKLSLDNLSKLQIEHKFEVVVVDNNSSDQTKKISKAYPFVRYILEPNTAFTKARNTGAQTAGGEILVFMDDDAILHPDSLGKIIKIFDQYPSCGLIAGRVEPGHQGHPPRWALDCQKLYNGWSIYTPQNISFLKHSTQTVPAAVGPLMAIRSDVYRTVGGFPPDTIGVETDDANTSFRKLYIGPGDYGISYLVRRAGWEIYYDEKIACTHLISPSRYTQSFWRSRLIGEGQEEAIIQRQLCHFSWPLLRLVRFITLLLYHNSKNKLSKSLKHIQITEELNLHHLRGYLEMSWILDRYPQLGAKLWELGYLGIDNKNYAKVVVSLPPEYLAINQSDIFYDNIPRHSLTSYSQKFEILNPKVYGHHSLIATSFFYLPFSQYLLDKLKIIRESCMMQ